MNKSIASVSFTFFLILSSMSLSHAAGVPQELPRSYGVLVLGMSKADIVSKTGVDFGRCVHCVEGEEEGDIRLRRAAGDPAGPSFDPAEAKIPGLPEGVRPSIISCFAFQNRLYGIVLMGVPGDPVQVREVFEELYGEPIKVENMESGITQVSWVNPSTILRIAYSFRSKAGRGEKGSLEISYWDTRISSTIPLPAQDK